VLVKLVTNERKKGSSSIGTKRPATVQDAAPPPKAPAFLPTMRPKEPKDMTLPELQQELR
jgi:phage terminase small subunit